MIRIQDLGEITYGGAVTLAEWWDNKRIGEGTITPKDVFKKASFYTYLGIGLVATLMSAFGWMRRWESWAEHISHGFLYDIPRFSYNLATTMTSEGRSSNSAVVKEAQKILQQSRNAAANQLAAAKRTGRTYEPEMKSVSPWAF
jgi:hypothetical protein